MAWGMENNTVRGGEKTTVHVADLRAVIADRLQAVQRRMDPTSVSAAFARANDNSQDNLIGSLIFGALCWTPFMDAFAGTVQNEAVAEAMAFASAPAAAALADGISLVWDENARRRRGESWGAVLKDGIYHGGRRQANIETVNKMKGRFNLVAANENSAYASRDEAEMSALGDLLVMLDEMESKGVTLLSLDSKDTVQKSLRQGKEALTKKKAPMQAASMIMRKAV